MHSPNKTSFRWLVHSFGVILFYGSSLVRFKAPRPPCLTWSAARSWRSVGTIGTSKGAGRKQS
eukprot:12504289-Ditylum_brightwellii.AAC.1